MYFFCRGRQNGTCDTPHIHIGRLEEAVEQHYATIRFAPAFIGEVRTHLATMLADEHASSRLLHEQLSSELKAPNSPD